jgi:two-component system chemotaxis response regulator CheB
MQSAHPVQLVTMGASAGGIRALSQVLSALPPDFKVPVVIVQHRRAHTPDLLPRVLSLRSAIPVQLAQPGGRLSSGTAFVAPADAHLLILPGFRFGVADGRKIHHVRSSADPLFASAASTTGGKMVAVVLTGRNSDASGGVQAVKAAGGTVIAQDEATSENFGMPASAIRSGCVDYILPLGQIGPTLVELTQGQAVRAEAQPKLVSGGGR